MKYISSRIEDDKTMSDGEENETSDTYLSTKTPLLDKLEILESTSYATSGASSDLGDYIYKFPSNFDVLREADFGNPNEHNAITIKYVHNFVIAFQKVLLNNINNFEPSTELPPFKFRWLEDNSALIEWIFKDFRIGFSIEPDPTESGWYLVSNDNLSEASASGALLFENLEPLILELLMFATANS